MPESDSLARRKRLIGRLGGYSKLLTWYRAKRPRWLWRVSSPFGKPTTRLVRENGLTIKCGPFEGVSFTDDALGRSNYLGSKLIGAYEPEVVDFLSRHAPESEIFVDIGSGDGYFCVGVEKTGPIRVIGFEANRFDRELAEEIAKANGASIEFRGFADPSALNHIPEGRLLLLSDIEGFEEDLIDPELVPRLSSATMVVEIHEHVRPDVGSTLRARFEHTHDIHHVAAVSRTFEVPELDGWDKEAADLVAYDGHSPGDGWMTFEPR